MPHPRLPDTKRWPHRFSTVHGWQPNKNKRKQMQTTQSTIRRKGGVGSTIAMLLLGLLLLVGIAMYCLTQLVPSIETDLNNRVTTALQNEGLTAEVEVAGTAITLSGLVDSAAAVEKAEQITRGVYGVSKVYNRLKNNSELDTNPSKTAGAASPDDDGSNTESAAGISIADKVLANQNSSEANPAMVEQTDPLPILSSLELVVNERKALVSGVLPNDAAAQRVKSAVAARYGSGNVEDQISIVPEAQAPSWLDGAESVIGNIDKIEDPSFKIAKDKVTIAGMVSSETLGAQQLSAAKRYLGNDLEVSATFAVMSPASERPAPTQTPRPTKKRPASLRIEDSNGGVRLTGTLNSFEDARDVRQGLANQFGNTSFDDKIIVDDSVTAANWISEALEVAEAVTGVSNFSVSINSGQMLLGGDVTNRETGRELTDTAAAITGNKLRVVNNYSVNQAELVIESREDELARELAQKLFALDTAEIIFEPGSAVLQENALDVLDKIASVISNYTEQVVEISGHTDASGDSVSNMELSKKRAVSVRDYLISKGLPSKQLRPIGYGEENPVADNSTEAGRTANRRIEFNL